MCERDPIQASVGVSFAKITLKSYTCFEPVELYLENSLFWLKAFLNDRKDAKNQQGTE